MYNVYHKYFLFIYIHAYLFVFLTENLINIFRIKICRICFICCNKFSTKKKTKKLSFLEVLFVISFSEV